jgi:hypothetical protein
MAQEQIQLVAELEATIARLEQREKRLRAVFSSAFTDHERRRDAREELESLLNEIVAVEDELLHLVSANGIRGPNSSVERDKPVFSQQ